MSKAAAKKGATKHIATNNFQNGEGYFKKGADYTGDQHETLLKEGLIEEVGTAGPKSAKEEERTAEDNNDAFHPPLPPTQPGDEVGGDEADQAPSKPVPAKKGASKK